MKVIDILKKLGEFENVCLRPAVIHPHDMTALFGTPAVLKSQKHIAINSTVERITTGQWQNSHCIFVFYRT
jgi:hypothetical protein